MSTPTEKIAAQKAALEGKPIEYWQRHLICAAELGLLLENIERLKEMIGLKTSTTTPTGTEARVCEDIAERQRLGLSKYGVTVEDNPLTLKQWLEHAYQETLDKAVYLRRAIEEIENAHPKCCGEVKGPDGSVVGWWQEDSCKCEHNNLDTNQPSNGTISKREGEE